MNEILLNTDANSGRVASTGPAAFATQARQLTWRLAERTEPVRSVVRDRDQKFADSFDAVSRSDRIEIIRTPFCAPQANGVAERFVRTVRSECLDWLLVLNRQHLEQVLSIFVDHYNTHRPHRTLRLTPPTPMRRAVIDWSGARVRSRGVSKFLHFTGRREGNAQKWTGSAG